jgi:hypothetical protein
MVEERGVVPMDPVEKFRWVFVNGPNQRGCDLAVSFSIEAVEAWKNFDIDVSLARFRMSVDHRWREFLAVQPRGQDL